MKIKYSIITLLLIMSACLNTLFSQEIKMRVTCDTTWEYNGKIFQTRPEVKSDENINKAFTFQFNSKLQENSPYLYRKFIDSIKADPNFCSYQDSLVSLVLKNDSMFNSSWCTNCVFESSVSKLPFSKELIIILDKENYYFNQWGSLTYGYGPRWGRMHRGLDLPLTTGDTIYSTFNGIVRYAQYNDGGYGNCVVVRNFNGIETLYAHMSKILVKPGELVYSKDVLGLGGSTGRSSGPHLHFETRYKGKSFDPLKIFDKKTFEIKSDTLIIQKKDITDPIIPRKYHVVRSGETLSGIARKHRTSVKKLQRLNKIKNPNKIAVGKKIRVR